MEGRGSQGLRKECVDKSPRGKARWLRTEINLVDGLGVHGGE